MIQRSEHNQARRATTALSPTMELMRFHSVDRAIVQSKRGEVCWKRLWNCNLICPPFLACSLSLGVPAQSTFLALWARRREQDKSMLNAPDERPSCNPAHKHELLGDPKGGHVYERHNLCNQGVFYRAGVYRVGLWRQVTQPTRFSIENSQVLRTQ